MPPFIPKMLSPRQKELVATVERLTRERGFPPTLREIGRAMRVTESRACQLAGETALKGRLTRSPGCARSWRVLPPPSSVSP